VKRIFAILLAGTLGFFLFPDAELSPEESVIATINEVAEASRRARPGDFMDHIAEGYSDEHLTRKSLKAFITRRLLGGGGLSVHLGSIDVTFEPGQNVAIAKFNARFPQSIDRVRPGQEEERFFSIKLTLVDDEWKILTQENQQE
jgi:hypothetical protein